MKHTCSLGVLLSLVVTFVFAQSPTFTSQPHIVGGFVCSGGTLQISGNTVNADFYQLESQGESGNWSPFGGYFGTYGYNAFTIEVANFTAQYTFRVKIVNKGTGEQQWSDPFFAYAQQPEIQTQPINLLQCYGADVEFIVGASGVAGLSYQWEKAEGAAESFSPISNSSKYKNTSTSTLGLINIKTSDNDAFRCKVTDGDGCATFSNAATLGINHMGTVKPTASISICEGANQEFYVDRVTGVPLSYQWSLNGGDLSESENFSGVATSHLTVYEVPLDLTTAGMAITYKNVLMNANGEAVEGTCGFYRERSGYTLLPQPEKPAIVKKDSVCGSGSMRLQIGGASQVEWYDQRKGSAIANNVELTTPNLEKSKYFYFRAFDKNNCFSRYDSVLAKVNPLPEIRVNPLEAICPDDEAFEIPYSNLNFAHEFSLYSNNLPNFQALEKEGIPDGSIHVPLPVPKASGNYTFFLTLESVGSGCEKSFSPIALNVKKATVFTEDIRGQSICEGVNFHWSSMAEGAGPVTYQWFRNGSVIGSGKQAKLGFAPLALGDSGQYRVEARAECGLAVSSKAKLEVRPVTKITKRLASASVCEGSSVRFSIEALGSGELHYQWTLDGEALGGDSDVLAISSVSEDMNGKKVVCTVSSDCGLEQSDTAALQVYPLPEPPVVEETHFCQNSEAERLIALPQDGNGLLWYGQEAFGGTAQIDAPIPETKVSGIFGFYVSQVDNKGCESKRALLPVHIDTALEASLLTSRAAVCPRGSLNNKVDIHAETSGGVGTYTYQWFLGDEAIDEIKDRITLDRAGKVILRIQSGACEIQVSETVSTVEMDNANGPNLSVDGQSAPYAFCPDADVRVLAGSGLNSAQVFWYASEDANSPFHSGSELAVNDLSSKRTYFVAYREEHAFITCETSRTSIVLDTLESPKATYTITAETCENAQNGAIELKPQTSLLPYLYRIEDAPYQEIALFENLSSGTYEIRIEDSNGCTGELIVQVSLADTPAFVNQPVDQNNCKGNTVYFTVSTGGEVMVYQWQRKLPNKEWADIPGENKQDLKVSNVGNPENPHRSQYRVILNPGRCQLVSDSATLFVNGFSAFLDNLIACGGDSALFSMPGFVGEALNFEWQERRGSSGPWETVQNGMHPNFMIYPVREEANDNYYRVRVDFSRGDGSSCVETSDLGRLIVPQMGHAVLSGNREICVGETVKILAEACNGEVLWSDGQKGDEISVSPERSTVYSAKCVVDGCEKAAENEVEISVKPGIEPPLLSIAENNVCSGDSTILYAENCAGEIKWNTGQTTAEVKVMPQETTAYWAECFFGTCTSPNSDTLEVEGFPLLKAGEIEIFSVENCAGYNPPAIGDVEPPKGGKGELFVQWESDGLCKGGWEEIVGANSLGYNPGYLQETTCFRRRVEDGCGNVLYSNISQIHIVADPEIKIEADNEVLCSGESLVLEANVSGGQGICVLTWQQNLKSGAESSDYWEDIGSTDSLVTVDLLENPGNENMFVYYRAIYDCEPNACNKAVSESIEIEVLPSNEVHLNIQDSTVCRGNNIKLLASHCGGELSWSDGFVGENRMIIAENNTVYRVFCDGACGSYEAQATIEVKESLEMPENLTPSSAISPDSVQFSALGKNLKWYDDEFATNPLGSPPVVHGVGEYTFWVSQSDEVCESPRLRIQTVIYRPLAILKESEDQYDCEGNSIKFTIEAEGIKELHYQWQRKRPGENQFIALSDEDKGIKGSQSPTLSVYGVGNAANPSESQYRCRVMDSLGQVLSKVYTLYANVIYGTLPNFDACVGDDFEIDVHANLGIVGDVASYQWQVRDDLAGEWVDLEGDPWRVHGVKTSKLTIKNIQVWNSGKYRCAIEFNTGGFVCTENTDQAKVTVGEYPNQPPDLSVDYCQGKRTKKLSFNAKPHDDIWYGSNQENAVGTSKRPKPDSYTPGEFTYWFAAESDEGCASPKAKYLVRIHPTPDLPKSTTPEFVMEGDTLQFSAEGQNLKWYFSRTGRKYQLGNPRYWEVDSYEHWVSQTSQYGCQGPRQLVWGEVLGRLGLKEPLESLADCEGNSIRFKAKGKGIGPLGYKWQKKRPTDSTYSFIDGETGDELKIPDVGLGGFPENTAIRVSISDTMGNTFISPPALVRVNKIEGKMDDQVYCAFGEWTPNTTGLHIQGEVEEYQLQKQEGAKWNLVASSRSLDFPMEDISGAAEDDFRISVVFKAEKYSSCMRSTPEFKFRMDENPRPPGKLMREVCQFASLTNKKLNLPDSQYVWYARMDTTLKRVDMDKLQVAQAKDTLFWYASLSKSGCRSHLDSALFSVKPVERLNLPDTEWEFCRFGKQDTLNHPYADSLVWFADPQLDSQLTRRPLLLKDSTDTFRYWLAKALPNGCYSPPVNLCVDVENCYLTKKEATLDSCITLSMDSLSAYGWHYFHTDSGKIVLGVNPKGLKIDSLLLTHKLTEADFLTDDRGHYALPRVFSLVSGSVLPGKISVRAYFDLDELEDYSAYFPAKETKEGLFWASGITPDSICANKLDEKGILSEVLVPNMPKDSIVVFEFDLENWGAFSILQKLDSTKIKGLVELDEGPEALLTDAYRNETPCLVYPNPAILGQSMNFLFDGKPPFSLQIFDKTGEIHIIESSGHRESNIKLDFDRIRRDGIYLFKMLGADGKVCVKRVALKTNSNR